MKKILHLWLGFLFFVIVVAEQGNAAFYNLPRGSFSLSLGGAAAAYPKYASAALYNPAYLPYLQYLANLEGYSHSLYGVTDIRESFIAAAFAKGKFGLGVCYFADELKNIYKEASIYYSFGMNIYKNFSAGISYISRTVSSDDLSTNAGDFSFFINYNLRNHINAFLSVKNLLQSEYTLISLSEKKSREVGAGLAFKPRPDILFIFDADRIDEPLNTFHFGIEYKIGILFLRMGVMPNIYAAGFGIQQKFYGIDFAVENVENLGLYALLTFRLNYGKKQ